MTLEQYKEGSIIKIEQSIENCEKWLNENSPEKFRNTRLSTQRRLDKLKQRLDRFSKNELTKEDLYYFEALYKTKEYDLHYISTC